MSVWDRRTADRRGRRRATGIALAAVLAIALAAAVTAPAGAGAAPDSAAAAPGADSVATRTAAPDSGARAVDDDATISAGPSPAEGLPISRIDIRPGQVFTPDSTSRLHGFQTLANHLHVVTRAGTIRRQLLFAPGDRWQAARGRETARILRSLGYLDPTRVEASRVGDSAVAVVETRDLWRTTPRFNIASASGRRAGSIGLTDRNLIGYGKSVSVFYRDDETGKSWNLAYDDPNLFGGRHRLRYAAGKGTEGATDEVAVGMPFFAEQTVRAYQGSWGRTTFVNHLYSGGVETANFDERVDRTEVWLGGRLRDGRPVRRLFGSFELYDRRLGPSRTQPGAPEDFAGGEENVRIRRLAGELLVWRPDFVERRNVNRVERIEDFDLGSQLAIKVGYAPLAFGSTQDEGYVRLRADAGARNRLGFGWLRTSGATRLVPESIERMFQLDARWYALPRPGHTLALGAYGVAGGNTLRDFQVTVGGLEGLRAYPLNAVAGRRLWRLNAEERWLFRARPGSFAWLGTAAFFDAARGWGAGAEGSGWFRDAGVGLRIGIPSWGLSEMMRLDVAWPIEPSRDGGHAPVLTLGSSQAF